ncbi:unnamed protein product [Polarella glacialis]|uniref:Uncharacterized protein n=1 Tax=Polarella glacialis TaxID=89957 RepID=A0A813GC10_POLGL|nr:unnamed protein product [Polarella glacialis]
MVHRQRDGGVTKDLLSIKRADEDRIAVDHTSDYWYVDFPKLTEKEAQTYHISLREKVIELLDITENDITTRSSTRCLHIFVAPSNLQIDGLRSLILLDAITAFHSHLCDRPLLFIRATNFSPQIRRRLFRDPQHSRHRPDVDLGRFGYSHQKEGLEPGRPSLRQKCSYG